MLILPNPHVPDMIWEMAETEEMKEVIGLYGKTYHFWQVDRGDLLPLGKPELMMSFTADEQARFFLLFILCRLVSCDIGDGSEEMLWRAHS